jgi:diacylglycerol kinase family enzyme
MKSAEPPGIDVVLNANARGLRPGRSMRERVLREAKRGGARIHETADLDALARTAREIAARGPATVILVGGDGSFMRGLSALAQAYGEGSLPPIALAPAGTVGNAALNLRLGDAARVVAAVCAGTARSDSSPTLRAVEEDGTARVGFTFGAGMVAQFFAVYYRAPRPGILTAAGIAARVFAGSFVGSATAREVLARAACRLEVDGELRPATGWSLIVASVMRNLGLHFHVTYRGGERPDRFHAVASSLPARSLGPQMTRVIAGRPLRGEPRVDDLVRSLTVEFEAGRGPYVLDGDVLVARSVRVEAGPVLRLLKA